MAKTPSKKNKSGNKASPLTGPSPAGAAASPFRDANADGSINCSAVFQARTSSADTALCPFHICLMSPGDMKKLKLFAGSCVAVLVGGINTLHLRVLPSPKSLPGSLVLNRIWSSNFSDQSSVSGSRKVAVIGDAGR